MQPLLVDNFSNDASTCFGHFLSEISELQPFQEKWLADKITGKSLAELGPDGFERFFQESFPIMTPEVQSRLFDVMRARIEEEQPEIPNSFISARIFDKWFPPGQIRGKIRLLRPANSLNLAQHSSVEVKHVAFAFSGGGIRSAAQCAGVLKAAANDHQSIKTVSCVSGGGYLGSALIDHQTYQTKFQWNTFFDHFRKNHGFVFMCHKLFDYI